MSFLLNAAFALELTGLVGLASSSSVASITTRAPEGWPRAQNGWLRHSRGMGASPSASEVWVSPPRAPEGWLRHSRAPEGSVRPPRAPEGWLPHSHAPEGSVRSPRASEG